MSASMTEALQELWALAGHPSTREMAIRTGNKVSLTTVNETVMGRRVPSLPMLLHIVDALGGDRETFIGMHRGLKGQIKVLRGDSGTARTDTELLSEILAELKAIRVVIDKR